MIGLWIHADEDDTQQVNASIIQESWRSIRGALEEADFPAPPPRPSQEDSLGPAMQAMGRRLSLSDLFGQRTGTGAGTGP